MSQGYLMHFGIFGQKWGVRRYQNPDGSLTAEGRKHYGYASEAAHYKAQKEYKNASDSRRKAERYSKNNKNRLKNWMDDYVDDPELKEIIQEDKEYRKEVYSDVDDAAIHWSKKEKEYMDYGKAWEKKAERYSSLKNVKDISKQETKEIEKMIKEYMKESKRS